MVDLNVLLDVLHRREPFVADARRLWIRLERREAEGWIAAHCVTTLHYLASRQGGSSTADRVLRGVLGLVRVATVDEPILRTALASGWTDYEDAVVHTSALACGCDAIVTRDARGFANAQLPVLRPAEAIEIIDAR